MFCVARETGLAPCLGCISGRVSRGRARRNEEIDGEVLRTLGGMV